MGKKKGSLISAIEEKTEKNMTEEPASDELKEELPTKLEMLDLKELLLQTEQVQRLDLQLQVMQLSYANVQRDSQQAQASRQKLLVDLRKKYKISEKDAIDPETGKITRNS